MNRENLQTGRQEAIRGFDIDGTFLECTPCGNGHINDTFMMSFDRDGETHRYSLQHMNRSVFRDPVSLMNNILHVTDYLKEQIRAQGGDPQDFYQSAVAFGNFQRMLADFPADTLTETIAGFHDTKARFAAFEKAVEEDVCGRAAGVQQEIRFIKDRYDVACVLGDLLEAGELPLRVTHNDTKSNNVLMDNATGKGLCVIDLDTVMPGLAVNDFGDSIRFGASTGAEDEKDLSRISCDMELYDIYAKGFVEGCGGALTDMEIECLPIGAKVMTYECGMRFLTDYLSGDTYFKVDYPTHNLDRTRTQLKLVWDMEQKWEQMQEIARKYKNKR